MIYTPNARKYCFYIVLYIIVICHTYAFHIGTNVPYNILYCFIDNKLAATDRSGSMIFAAHLWKPHIIYITTT